MKTRWLDAINQLNAQGDAYVLVTLLGTHGSTPRDAGTKMVVSANENYDTIGGGHLEYQVIATAHKMLTEQPASTISQHIEYYPLGPSLGQCCGGSTTVLFEQFAGHQINIMLFGAGHVGKALTGIIAELPCKVNWVDNRQTQFPSYISCSSTSTLGNASFIPNNITMITSEVPADEVAVMPPDSYYIIMTHSHQLDFDICEAILKRNNFSYLGLIGSEIKRQRFRQRLIHKQHPKENIDRIRCPMGLSNVPGKQPMEVAVSIAGEIINHYHQQQPKPEKKQGVQWKQLKRLLTEKA